MSLSADLLKQCIQCAAGHTWEELRNIDDEIISQHAVDLKRFGFLQSNLPVITYMDGSVSYQLLEVTPSGERFLKLVQHEKVWTYATTRCVKGKVRSSITLYGLLIEAIDPTNTERVANPLDVGL